MSSEPLVGTSDRYRDNVPDTVDLASRAQLAINGLIGTADPEHKYETYHTANFNVHPPYMNHVGNDDCGPKALEALSLMRVMSGSEQDMDVQDRMFARPVADIEDGLWWINREDRPWVSRRLEEDVADVMGQSRLMLALMAQYQWDPNPESWGQLENMASALRRIAIDEVDYAYYPSQRYYRSGWKTVVPVERTGSYPQGNALRALSRWYGMSGDEPALELAKKLARTLLSPSRWVPTAEPKMVVSAEHGHWSGHLHSTTAAMMGLLEYAIVTNDAQTKRFVREFYEYTRAYGIARIGFFPAVVGDYGSGGSGVPQNMECGCNIGDMIYLAVRLTESGVGEYWEDVDQYVRNQLIESQFTNAELLREMSEAGPEHTILPGGSMTDQKVIERNLGNFSSGGDPTLLYGVWTMCCVGNGPIGMYYAWKSIVSGHADMAQVNLLLNRASPWLDVDSYLPYEGKVVLKIKACRRTHVRVPMWVNKKAVRYSVNSAEIPAVWLGNYLVVDGLAPGDRISIRFPTVEATESHTIPDYGHTYTCRFRGNTLVDISPRPERAWAEIGQDDGIKSPVAKGYPIYLRDHYREDGASMKETTRYVSPVLVWE